MSNAVKCELGNSSSNPVFDIVALAASADGINAIIEILSNLPNDFPAAIVVVKHLAPQYRSFLAEILSRHTLLTVKEAENGEGLQPSVVYIAPPNYHLLVNADRTLSLTQTVKVRFVRPSADILFPSVAESYKERGQAVVLTGADMDGSQGVEAIKKMGGTAIAQDEVIATELAEMTLLIPYTLDSRAFFPTPHTLTPDTPSYTTLLITDTLDSRAFFPTPHTLTPDTPSYTSKVFGMPGDAIATGCVDFILPLNEISGAIASLVNKGAIA